MGTSAAPLRKELMDSGLGEALVGGGLQGDLRQPVFSIGLKGAAPENFQKAGFVSTAHTLAEFSRSAHGCAASQRSDRAKPRLAIYHGSYALQVTCELTAAMCSRCRWKI